MDLKPEQRTDRTGRTQTRWVRDAGPARSRGREIPPVAASPAPPAVPQDLLEAVGSTHAETLGACRPDLLARLARRLRDLSGDPTAKATLRTHLSAALASRGPTDIHHLALFSDAIGSSPSPVPGNLWAVIEGITYRDGEQAYRPFAGVEDLSTLPAAQIEQARALVYAACTLDDRHTDYYGGRDSGDYSDYDTDEDGWWEDVDGDGWEPERAVIMNGDLVRLLMDHPDAAERIVRIANTEDIDIRLIRARIEHPEQALSEGVL